MNTRLFLLISLFFLIAITPNIFNVKAEKPKIVNLSLILFGQFNETMQEPLLNFLNEVNYTKWTFAIWKGHFNTILSNSTFINELKKYGELIPAINSPNAQFVSLSERQTMLEDCINNWTSKVGYKPKGIFMFQPDTYFANIMYDEGLYYMQGYCFEQYAVVDYMDMRGGWQSPYYASRNHVLIPNSEKGLVILPHNIWDWRASLEISHRLNTHIKNAYDEFNGNFTKAKNYCLSLIDTTLNSMNPFGYVMVQTEFDMMYNNNFVNNFKTYINELLAKNYDFQMCNETAIWFRNNYDSTPTYHFTFTSPYDNKKVEWYYNVKYRITRYDDKYVVGFIDYRKQDSDPYLTKYETPDWEKPASLENCISNSLNYTINDYGNGYLRYPSQGDRIKFSGKLSFFPSEYYSKTIIYECISLCIILSMLGLALSFLKGGK